MAVQNWIRRVGVLLGLVTLVAGGVSATAANAAARQVPPCQEYVEVFQSTQTTNIRVGPRLDSRWPGEMTISNSALQTRFLTHTGVTRPRRPATFRYIRHGATVYAHQTRNSRDNGVIHHEDEQISLNFGNPGDEIQVFADFVTRCGGDAVPWYNRYLGVIKIVP